MTTQIIVDDEMKKALFEVFQHAGLEVPQPEIRGKDLQEALTKIKQAGVAPPPELEELSEESPSSGEMGLEALAGQVKTEAGPQPPVQAEGRNILIVGELGIVAYQLKHMLTHVGAQVTIAKTEADALSAVKKGAYECAIVDLMMPTEREGLVVIRQMAQASDKKLHMIAVVSPGYSGVDRLANLCKSMGVTHFVEKKEGWYEEVLRCFA